MTKSIFKGGGAFSDVFRYEHTFSNEPQKQVVAIKRLRFYMKEDIAMLFEKEIAVWSNLRHRNIVPLLGFTFDADCGYPLLISEWMENGSAWRYIYDNPKCDVLKLIHDIAKGLSYLHDNRIVHSDIKTDNVLVSSTGDAMICDFGLARAIASSMSFKATRSGSLKGTSRYLAYELLALPSKYPTHTKATDVWAYGMTVYELLARERAYGDRTDIQTSIAIFNRELPALPGFDECEGRIASDSVLQSLWQICLSCWEHDPEQRIDMIAILYHLSLISNSSRPSTYEPSHSEVASQVDYGTTEAIVIPDEVIAPGLGTAEGIQEIAIDANRSLPESAHKEWRKGTRLIERSLRLFASEFVADAQKKWRL